MGYRCLLLSHSEISAGLRSSGLLRRCSVRLVDSPCSLNSFLVTMRSSAFETALIRGSNKCATLVCHEMILLRSAPARFYLPHQDALQAPGGIRRRILRIRRHVDRRSWTRERSGARILPPAARTADSLRVDCLECRAPPRPGAAILIARAK